MVIEKAVVKTTDTGYEVKFFDGGELILKLSGLNNISIKYNEYYPVLSIDIEIEELVVQN